MKKIIFFTAVSFYFIFFAKATFSWFDCPFGKVNDPYPGSCFRYVDTNNNKICDHSEPAPTIQPANKVTSQPGNQPTSQLANRLYFWTIFLTLSFYFLHWYLVFKTTLSKKFKWLNQAFFAFLESGFGCEFFSGWNFWVINYFGKGITKSFFLA